MVLVVSRVHDRPSHMALITWFVLLLCIIKGYMSVWPANDTLGTLGGRRGYAMLPYRAWEIWYTAWQ